MNTRMVIAATLALRLTLRLSLRDRAGNEGVDEREVTGGLTAELYAPQPDIDHPGIMILTWKVGGIPLVPEAVRQRVVRLRKRGYGWLGIAKALNDDKVKPVRGGQKWYASTAKRVWQSAQYIAERERIAQAARQRRSGRSLYAACSASRIRSGGSARSGDEGLAGAVAAMGSGAGAGDSCVPAPAHKSQAAVPRSAVRRRSPPADARSP